MTRCAAKWVRWAFVFGALSWIGPRVHAGEEGGLYRPLLGAILRKHRGPARLEALDAYVRDHPDDPYGHLELGLALVKNQYLPLSETNETKDDADPAGTEATRQARLKAARTAFVYFGRHAPEEAALATYALAVADLYLLKPRAALEGIAAFRQKQGLDADAPLPPMLRRIHGIALREAGRLDEALAAFDALPEGDRYKHHNLALTYLKQDNFANALAHFKRGVLGANADAYAEVIRATEHEQRGEWDAAATRYERALEAGRRNPELFFLLREAGRRLETLAGKAEAARLRMEDE